MTFRVWLDSLDFICPTDKLATFGDAISILAKLGGALSHPCQTCLVETLLLSRMKVS